MAHRTYNKDGFLLSETNRPIYMIQRSSHPPAIATPQSVGLFKKRLRELNLERIDVDAVIRLTEYLQPGTECIPLGSIGLIDYYIHCEILHPQSVNGGDASYDRAHVPELLKKLHFELSNARADTRQSQRLAFPLGRIYASHHNDSHSRQSHWVVFMDHDKTLWALYADGIDVQDEERLENGNSHPYDEIWDTAFGANRTFGHNIVCLGHVSKINFKEGLQLNYPQIKAMEWFTRSLDFDIRKPVIEPSKLHVYLNVATTSVEIAPHYFFKFSDIFLLEQENLYIRFCNHVSRKSQGSEISRPTMDAAWVKYVTWHFKRDIRAMASLTEQSIRQHILSYSNCIMEIQAEDANRYWSRVSQKSPHLDTTNITLDAAVSNNPTLRDYVLSICQSFQLVIRGRLVGLDGNRTFAVAMAGSNTFTLPVRPAAPQRPVAGPGAMLFRGNSGADVDMNDDVNMAGSLAASNSPIIAGTWTEDIARLRIASNSPASLGNSESGQESDSMQTGDKRKRGAENDGTGLDGGLDERHDFKKSRMGVNMDGANANSFWTAMSSGVSGQGLTQPGDMWRREFGQGGDASGEHTGGVSESNNDTMDVEVEL